MIVPLLVLVLGLVLAGAAATVGAAAAAVSQLELTRWVSHRLRGVAEAARLLENPGHVLAVANALTTLGIVCAALGDARLARRNHPHVSGSVHADRRGAAVRERGLPRAPGGRTPLGRVRSSGVRCPGWMAWAAHCRR